MYSEADSWDGMSGWSGSWTGVVKPTLSVDRSERGWIKAYCIVKVDLGGVNGESMEEQASIWVPEFYAGLDSYTSPTSSTSTIGSYDRGLKHVIDHLTLC